MIQLIGVSKRYGRGPLVVHDIDVEIGPGTPLVVHGVNGSGKSTLLRLIAGCVAPTHGRVDGRPRTVGYVPDRFPAHLRMPAEAYLRHLQRVRPGSPRGTNPVPLLSALGFRGGLDTPMNRLSKGNAQKVGLSQALSSGAPLLVLDEPWSGLDTDARPALTATVARLAANGTTVVLTDHTRTAETLPEHQVLHLRDGRLTTAGPRMIMISLRCADPDRVAEHLPPHGTAQRHPGGLHLRVAAADVDALLTIALRLGCSVLEVRP
ncbi:ABC transporter ATP-binding protein [Streptomyces sp. MN03-5084-2B]|nr:ABC transporter ATP-binding protein [Streptomyces sp. MN03-5084-2B]